MRSLGVQLPAKERRTGPRATVREAFFFCISFLATFIAAMLVLKFVL